MRTPRVRPRSIPSEMAVTDATNSVEIADGAFTIQATVIAEGFAIDPALVQRRMREGQITCRCERGLGQDVGHYRLTFFYDSRRFHLVVDEAGNLVERSPIVTDPARVPGFTSRA